MKIGDVTNNKRLFIIRITDNHIQNTAQNRTTDDGVTVNKSKGLFGFFSYQAPKKSDYVYYCDYTGWDGKQSYRIPPKTTKQNFSHRIIILSIRQPKNKC